MVVSHGVRELWVDRYEQVHDGFFVPAQKFHPGAKFGFAALDKF